MDQVRASYDWAPEEYIRHLYEELRHKRLDFYFRGTEEIANWLRTTGFEIESVTGRGPYAPEIEYQSRRAYIFARK